ncbi:MAG: peptidoglycan DD-metalloendopeptidase family protein [Acidimicrobiales bacterium]
MPRRLLVASLAVTVLALTPLLAALGLAGTTAAPDHGNNGPVPDRAAQAYRAAASRCPGLTWELLAGIGHVESGHGTAHGATIDQLTGEAAPWIFGPALNGVGGTQRLPIGRWVGWWGLTGRWEQAVGPMQFRAPTFTAHATDGDHDGTTNPHDLDDAAATAATHLCAATGGHITDPRAALTHYNHGRRYADQVLAYANQIAAATAPAASPLRAGICPVARPTTFTDTWGAPRSGGRSHKGVDMFAAHRTPVVAPVPGVVEHFNDSLGGQSFRLWGDDGNYYYGTHLSGYGHAGRVLAGTTIGYVGTTGNAARTPPHLHLEIHPGRQPGDPPNPINPTPTAAAWCANRQGAVLAGTD